MTKWFSEDKFTQQTAKSKHDYNISVDFPSIGVEPLKRLLFWAISFRLYCGLLLTETVKTL